MAHIVIWCDLLYCRGRTNMQPSANMHSVRMWCDVIWCGVMWCRWCTMCSLQLTCKMYAMWFDIIWCGVMHCRWCIMCSSFEQGLCMATTLRSRCSSKSSCKWRTGLAQAAVPHTCWLHKDEIVVGRLPIWTLITLRCCCYVLYVPGFSQKVNELLADIAGLQSLMH